MTQAPDLLSLRSVSKAYGPVPVLHEIDLAIRDGRIVAAVDMKTDRQAGRQSSNFQRLDTDRDGFVTLTEFMVQADRNFARCDTDRNGRIDTAECRQALQRKPAER